MPASSSVSCPAPSPRRRPCPAPRAARSAVLAAAALLGAAAPHPARAGDDRDALLLQLRQFTAAIATARSEGDRAASYLARPASECVDVVRRLAAAGMKPDDVIDGSEPYPFAQAGDRCRDYAQWRGAVQAGAAIAEAGTDLAMSATIAPGEVSEQLATSFGKVAATCSAAVDAALAGGTPPTLAVRIRSNLGDEAMTLPDARARVCEKLAAWAKAFGPATIAAKQAAAEAARTRYASVGAAGDRLSWLTYYDPDGRGATWFLPGCKEEGDPRRLAKAPVLLQWWSADDGTQTIRRLQFKGNKLVKDTTRTFLTEGAARAACK
ncbi:MAG TPA: hypothetical protein VHE35_08450 [Kofleriaceae bacterium]|nr:hypothetical protein [Kofleriaceae bacterium]